MTLTITKINHIGGGSMGPGTASYTFADASGATYLWSHHGGGIGGRVGSTVRLSRGYKLDRRDWVAGESYNVTGNVKVAS